MTPPGQQRWLAAARPIGHKSCLPHQSRRGADFPGHREGGFEGGFSFSLLVPLGPRIIVNYWPQNLGFQDLFFTHGLGENTQKKVFTNLQDRSSCIHHGGSPSIRFPGNREERALGRRCRTRPWNWFRDPWPQAMFHLAPFTSTWLSSITSLAFFFFFNLVLFLRHIIHGCFISSI